MEQTRPPVIAFLGDDVTAGNGASDKKHNFCARLEEITGFTIENNGVEGARITPQKNVAPGFPKNYQTFLKWSATLNPEADIVFVFGGTNDFGLGNVELGKLGNNDPCTFYGALALLCQSLLKHYRKQQLIFVLPMPRFDQSDPRYGENQEKAFTPLSLYCAAIEDVTDSYGIFALDLTGIFPVPKNGRGDEYTADGIHPNDRGHDLLAQIFACYLWDHCRFEPRCFPKEDPLKQ